MPKAIKKKAAKPVAQEEGVKNVIHDLRESFARRQRLLLPILVGAVVVVILISGVSLYRSNTAAKARTLEYKAYATYYGLHQRQPLPKAEQYQLALEGFKNAYETRKTAYSLFYMANCYYNLGRYDEALKTLKELNERFPDDENFVPLSYHKMAVISLVKGDKESALKLLEAIANYKAESFKDLAIADSARILESMGRTEEAAKKYEELKKGFPDSPFLKPAQARPTAQSQPGAKKD